MKYLIDSISEMNFNYLYIDEKSLSYKELLNKFIAPDPNLNQNVVNLSQSNDSYLNVFKLI